MICLSSVKIDSIILLGDCPLLQIVDWHTDGILQHYHSYMITSTRMKRTLYLKDLIDPRPLNSHTITGDVQSSYVITIRSTVISSIIVK